MQVDFRPHSVDPSERLPHVQRAGRASVTESIGEIKEPSGEQQELGSERVVIEIGDEWMHDGAADRGREHGGRNAVTGPGIIAHQEPVETVHCLPEWFVVSEESDDDGITEEGALHTAPFNSEVNDAGDQHITRQRAGRLSLSCRDCRFDIPEFYLSDGKNDLLFCFELVVHGRLGYADGVGDHLEGGTTHTVLGEQVEGGVDNTLLRGTARNGRWGDGAGGMSGKHPPRVATIVPD